MGLAFQRCFLLSQSVAVCTAHQISLYHLILNSVAEGPFISGENIDTSSDLMLAQMLQMEFDREYDAQLRREEKKFNGDSKGTRALMTFPPGGRKCLCTLLNKPPTLSTFKVSISFENYRKVHPFEDSDSSEDEVDWHDTRDDPYRPGASCF